jgi:hypothetical protein
LPGNPTDPGNAPAGSGGTSGSSAPRSDPSPGHGGPTPLDAALILGFVLLVGRRWLPSSINIRSLLNVSGPYAPPAPVIQQESPLQGGGAGPPPPEFLRDGQPRRPRLRFHDVWALGKALGWSYRGVWLRRRAEVCLQWSSRGPPQPAL